MKKVFIVDGYINKWIMVYDFIDNGFEQLWGVYGKFSGGGIWEGSFDQFQVMVNVVNISIKVENFGDIVYCVI